MRKRILSVLLCFVMVIGLLPTAALATDEEGGNDNAPPTVSDNKAYVLSTKQEYDSLDTAMSAASSGDTIYLGKGTYCGNSTNSTQKNSALEFTELGETKMKSLTFVGAGTDETTWQIRAQDNPTSSSDGPCDYSFDGSDSITFENMTIVGSMYSNGTTVQAKDLQGLVRIQNITLKNCTFNGRADYRGYETTTFENVIFNAPGTEASGISDVDYSLWTYTGKNYTFKNCTFNSAGKTINVYRHGTDQFPNNVTINFESCTVKNTTHKKQAMKINDKTMGDYKYIINISGDNKIEGIEPNKFTCSRLFGFDPDDNDPNNSSENSGRTIVYIEKEKVWESGKRTVDHNHDFTTGSYNNGVATDNANKYTDGYKDDAFTTTYSSWVWDQSENKLARTATKTCNYCGETVKTTEYKDLELDVSRSKTATTLDSSDQSTVTLSLPSAAEAVESDIVFVIDGSSSVGSQAVEKSLAMLNELKTSANKSGAAVSVCVVKFKRQAYKSAWFDLSTQYKSIETAMEGKYSGGTNIEAGLLAGKAALDEDTEVSAARKYLILISDGSTYLYSKGGDWTSDTPYTRSYYAAEPYNSVSGGFYDESLYCPSNGGEYYNAKNVVRPSNTSDPDAWRAYLEDVGKRNEESGGDQYD